MHDRARFVKFVPNGQDPRRSYTHSSPNQVRMYIMAQIETVSVSKVLSTCRSAGCTVLSASQVDTTGQVRAS